MRKKGHVNAEKKIFFYRLQMNRKCKAVLFFFVASTGCMSYWLMDSGKAVSKVRRSLYLEDDMNSTNQDAMRMVDLLINISNHPEIQDLVIFPNISVENSTIADSNVSFLRHADINTVK